jgi:acyl-CoA reductase-like NAD-dependent aldehyde dehydrogenase
LLRRLKVTKSQSAKCCGHILGTTIISIEVDGEEQALKKLDNAWHLFKDKTRWLPLHRRIHILENLIELMVNHKTVLAQRIATEGGKPLTDARVEVDRAINGVRLSITAVSEKRGEVIPLGHQAASAGRMAFTQKQPRGVVLAFSAFNHPLNLVIHQVIPAFAAGCPCVVKPAADTPLSCIKLIELMLLAGAPEDYVQVVVTQDHDVSGALVSSDKIAFFSFIGSARVGWMLRSKLKPGVRCALEHGGVAPCIVTDTADLDKAIPSIVKGAFYHAGQVCVSTQRIYVDAAIYPAFIKGLCVAVESLVLGDATQEHTDVGPLIRQSEAKRVNDWVLEAVELGAEVLLGGEMVNGYYHQPTVLLNVPDTARIAHQEVFGPVVSVYRYENFDDIIEKLNLPSIAFQASVFTNDLSMMYQAYETFNASAVMVNDHTAFRDDVMPFAGLESSGLGVGGIPYTIEEMQFEKMLVLKQD